MFPKTLIINSLSRSYTHGGEKIKQTHVPVPAALELRRAVVAKVKAHYLLLLRMRRGVFFEVMICSNEEKILMFFFSSFKKFRGGM